MVALSMVVVYSCVISARLSCQLVVYTDNRLQSSNFFSVAEDLPKGTLFWGGQTSLCNTCMYIYV